MSAMRRPTGTARAQVRRRSRSLGSAFSRAGQKPLHPVGSLPQLTPRRDRKGYWYS